eukprot:TRINITY_DN10361_c0_g1_i1.p1 TRINITY_DN10361_c0_g1~~TRINITY_DN10361_c0_g1_i1.p1  ORF type:complete len:632 (+),score=114.93 TRINITY_DN10361_c0_g1_i1:51-1946(+)
MSCPVFVLLFLVHLFALGEAKEYTSKDAVTVMVNTLGPFSNPSLKFEYYSLPFCMPKDLEGADEDDQDLGEVLAGDRRRPSAYDIRFLVANQWQSLCSFSLTQDEIRDFRNAIADNYIFEMFIDNLPVKGFVGEMEQRSHRVDNHLHNETRYYLFTHLDFSIAFNGAHVISVNLTTDPEQRVELEYGKDIPVEFSYSTHWRQVNVPYVDRQWYHARHAINDQPTDIHWISIINSLALIGFLCSVLVCILIRFLNKDVARYMELEDDEEEKGQKSINNAATDSTTPSVATVSVGAGGESQQQAQVHAQQQKEESGWKLVHGDVFRPPSCTMLFSVCIGAGTQILVLVVSLLLLSVIGTFYPGSRGKVYSAAVAIYCITSYIAGYISCKFYLQLGGERWATNAILVTLVFAGPFALVFFCINIIASYYGSSTAIPFSFVILIALLWAAVIFPLTIMGAIQARKSHTPLDAPCKTNRVEREIPPVPWFRSVPVQFFFAGFLPFSSIYIELHYILASVWGHRVYTLFGILAIVFTLLLIVTICVAIALLYMQLASEDYRWWWRSFFFGASTGLFIFSYAAYFYFYRSDMTGLLQAIFFFGYCGAISYAFSLMLGSVSFFCAFKFVSYLFTTVHVD